MAAGETTVSAIETVEMHTGGEPVRIVTAGYPPILGAHDPREAALCPRDISIICASC